MSTRPRTARLLLVALVLFAVAFLVGRLLVEDPEVTAPGHAREVPVTAEVVSSRSTATPAPEAASTLPLDAPVGSATVGSATAGSATVEIDGAPAPTIAPPTIAPAVPSAAPTTRAQGRVVTSRGDPCPDIQVELRLNSRQWVLTDDEPLVETPLGEVPGAPADAVVAEDRTRLDGRFELELPREGSGMSGFLVVVRDPAGLALAQRFVASVQAGTTCVLPDLVLRPARRIEVVARAAGRPLAGVAVELLDPWRWGSEGRLATTTGEDGVATFLLEVGATPARLEVRLEAEGLAPARRELPEGEAEARLEVDLSAEAALAGRVLGPRGEPLKGALVATHPAAHDHVLQTASSDDDGRFVLRGLAPGAAYTVRARELVPGALAPVAVEVRLPSPGVELRLGLAGRLRVTIVSAPRDPEIPSFEDLELFRAGPTPGSREEVPILEVQASDWGDDPEARPSRAEEAWDAPAPAPPKEPANEKRLAGLAPGRYWIQAIDRYDGAASPPVEVLVIEGQEAEVTLTVLPRDGPARGR